MLASQTSASDSTLKRQVSLQPHNTLGVDSLAHEFASVTSEEQLYNLTSTTVPIVLLGGGSNVVLKKFVHGRVIRNAIRRISFETLDGGKVRVRAGAGESWNELVRATVGRGIVGLENLILIPGLVGGAPYQNISAYGRELAELVEGVRVFDLENREFLNFPRTECAFRYRDSLFKTECNGRYVITCVHFILGACSLTTSYKDVKESMKQWPSYATTSRAVAESVARIRRHKLPDCRVHGNVGSFFKNPTLSVTQYDALKGKLDIAGYRQLGSYRVPAARLIDACGWKGRVIGNVNVWYRQPLVLVNGGCATGTEFLNVAERIADDVYRRYDVWLELEPVVLGEDR